MKKQQIINWLFSDETGVSSMTIAACALGVDDYHGCHPWDVADFKRCLNLIEAAPEAKKCFPKLAKKSKKWENLIRDWDKIEETLRREITEGTGRAPKAYAMIKDCINDR